MKKHLSLLLLAGLCLALPQTAAAQRPDHRPDPYAAYRAEVYRNAQGDSLPYRLLEPEVLKAGKKYPLVLFLHGAGERGRDNQRQLLHGGQLWLNPVNRQDYPAFVLYPQCPESGYWAYPSRPASFEPDAMKSQAAPTPVYQLLKELLDRILADPRIDPNRVYVMGLSMGGMGTFDLVIRYPQLFAAAVPICGSVRPDRLAAAKRVPFRIYHGDADPTVPVTGSRQAYLALKAAGAKVTYTEYPGVGHSSWNQAFNDPTLLPWLFKQKK